MTEAMRYAYRDRNLYLGDPAFVDNPVARLISTQNAAAIRARIAAHRATPSAALGGSAPHARKRHHHALFGGRRLGQRGIGHVHHQ